jgi:hypothetical protein
VTGASRCHIREPMYAATGGFQTRLKCAQIWQIWADPPPQHPDEPDAENAAVFRDIRNLVILVAGRRGDDA